MDLLVSQVLEVLIKRIQLALNSLKIDMAYVLVLKQINDNFFDLGRYLALVIELNDPILLLFLKPLLIIL
jgi:hypothetical protein